jgi:hypothetical protein
MAKIIRTNLLMAQIILISLIVVMIVRIVVGILVFVCPKLDSLECLARTFRSRKEIQTNILHSNNRYSNICLFGMWLRFCINK